uniref:Uncharacterized protein n=1 Tax=Rhizophora mucronata TaxID=61149 RepID=A0A2P2QZY8_RHIMU
MMKYNSSFDKIFFNQHPASLAERYRMSECVASVLNNAGYPRGTLGDAINYVNYYHS